MNYRELKKQLNGLTEEELDNDVTVYDESDDEYFKIEDTDFTVESDVIDDGHFVIILNRG